MTSALRGEFTTVTDNFGHHVSNTVPVTGALPYDRAAILRELDNAIARFPEAELKDYRNRILHL